MNQIKIGKFIADCRKEKGLTQSMLAEHFGISDRAISKWENGKCLPDASIMIDLCNLLGISVNELLSGDKITMENYAKTAEENLVQLKKRNEELSKHMLNLEIILIVIAIGVVVAGTLLAQTVFTTTFLKVFSIVVSFIIFFIAAFASVRIEQKAGFYKCKGCGKTYEPTYNQVLWSMHMGRSHKMKCPHCGEKYWSIKVVSETQE